MTNPPEIQSQSGKKFRYPDYEREPLAEFLVLVAKNRWLVLAAFVGVTSSALIGSLLMDPVYVAITSVQIQDKELNLSPELLRPIGSLIGNQMSRVGSEVTLLSSRTIAEQVVRPGKFSRGQLLFMHEPEQINSKGVCQDRTVAPSVGMINVPLPNTA